MIILENQLLNDKMFLLPKDITDHLKLILNNNLDKKNSKGYKRLNSLINVNYNKRNNQNHDKKYISYSDLKRINHDFDNMPHNKKNIEFILNGGEIMNNWVKQTLNNSRENVEAQLKKIKNDTRRKNKIKPSNRPTRPVSIKNELNSLTEDYDYNHPYIEKIEEFSPYYVFNQIQDNHNLWTPLINPMMYHKALSEFVKFGYLTNFPSKYIYQWFGIIMKNTAILKSCTEIAGHDIYYPIDDLIDAYFNGDEEEFQNYKNEHEIEDDSDAYDVFCDENGIYDKLQLPDGSDGWSDFGINPLEKIISEYNRDLKPEEVLVLINKILDVTHQRGDLSSIFIDGGANSLNKISFNENKKIKKVFVNENQLNELRQQLILPFDGNKNKMIYQHFIDWLESIGKYGNLPPSNVTFNQLLNYTIKQNANDIANKCIDNIEMFRDSLDYILSDIDVEEIEKMLDIDDELERNEIAESIKENYDSETLISNLNNYGLQTIRELIPDYIEEILGNNYFEVKSNENNLVMIERVIELPNLTNNDSDFYKELINNYKGIGNYWSFDKGDAYWSKYKGQTITIVGLVNPQNIDIIQTIYCSLYDLSYEKEVYIPKGEVEIVEIISEDDKHFPLKQHIIVNV